MRTARSPHDSGGRIYYDIECFYNGLEPDNTVLSKYFKRFAADHENLVPFRTEWCVFNEESSWRGLLIWCFRTSTRVPYLRLEEG
jgi:hypothetical protein